MTINRALASFGVRAAAMVGALLAATAVGSTPADAQQQIDEPRIDPIFGQKQKRRDSPDVLNDDEFDDYDKPWSPFRGLVGVLTFLTPDTTDLSIGVGPVYQPDYFGSDDFELEADPQVYVKFRRLVFFDDDGADFALFGFSGFSFGPSIRIVGDRREEENPALVGLGDVGLTAELGGFAATTFLDRFSFRFKARKGFRSGHRGLIVDAATTAVLFRYGPVSMSVTGQAAWIGERYADTYFSVTPEQSVASGLPIYDAGAGLRDFGGSVNGYINVGKRWSLNPYASYRRIIGDVADAPLVAIEGDRNQYIVGFHLMREFEFSMFRRRR
ncbi:MAG: MipA/OmpV family protein [Pseudomonadota bacterium]